MCGFIAPLSDSLPSVLGIDDDDLSTEEPISAPTEDMPPLEEDDDASRMEEVD